MKTIIYFDGECILCNRSIAFIYRHSKPGQFYFGLLQNQEHLASQFIHSGYTTVTVIDDGQTYVRASALIAIAKKMNQPYPFLAKLLSIIPISWFNGMYDFISRHRMKIYGKKKQCSVPQEIDRKYFVDDL